MATRRWLGPGVTCVCGTTRPSAVATGHDQAAALVVIEPELLASAGPFRRRAYLSAVDGLVRSLRSSGGRLRVIGGDPAEVIPAWPQGSEHRSDLQL